EREREAGTEQPVLHAPGHGAPSRDGAGGPASADGRTGAGSGAGGPYGCGWSSSSGTSPLRSSAAVGCAIAAVNMPLSELDAATISPTGNPAGKRPPSPEVIRRSPTRTSALIGMLGSSSRSMAPLP